MPFTTIEDLYYNTDFRISVIPNSAQHDDFSQSTDQLIQKIYEERIKPHLQEYLDSRTTMDDSINFIKNDFKTAVYALYGTVK